MKTITLKDNRYTIEKDYKNGYDFEALEPLYTDYFERYDYLLGDWAYGKLRLKGFCDKENKHFNKINDISKIDIYIEKQCAYECRYFILKKVKDK